MKKEDSQATNSTKTKLSETFTYFSIGYLFHPIVQDGVLCHVRFQPPSTPQIDRLDRLVGDRPRPSGQSRSVTSSCATVSGSAAVAHPKHPSRGQRARATEGGSQGHGGSMVLDPKLPVLGLERLAGSKREEKYIFCYYSSF